MEGYNIYVNVEGIECDHRTLLNQAYAWAKCESIQVHFIVCDHRGSHFYDVV